MGRPFASLSHMHHPIVSYRVTTRTTSSGPGCTSSVMRPSCQDVGERLGEWTATKSPTAKLSVCLNHFVFKSVENIRGAKTIGALAEQRANGLGDWLAYLSCQML